MSHKIKIKSSIKRAIKKGDFFQKIFCYILIKLGYSNEKLQALEIRNKKFIKLKKKYNNIINKLEYEKENELTSNNIWICWFQGIDNAPKIVQQCINSIKTFMNNYKINIITEENLNDYIDIPDYILKKFNKGIITYAHLSDIIRTELLIKYGGIWIDATTYMTSSLPNYIENSNLFLYNYKSKEDKTIKCNSWFIKAPKNCRILKVVRELLYEYWKKENKLTEYFLWHHFMTIALEKYMDDYKEIPYITDDICHMLAHNLLEKYNDYYFQYVKNITPINKLTYKVHKDIDINGTFYAFLENGDL